MKNLLDLLRLDGRQIFWAFLIIPVLTIEAISHLRTAWQILNGREASLHWAYKTQIWLVKTFSGQDAAKEYHAKMIREKTQSKSYAYTLIFSGIWVIVLMISLLIILIYNISLL
jgi:hypothetical protein